MLESEPHIVPVECHDCSLDDAIRRRHDRDRSADRRHLGGDKIGQAVEYASPRWIYAPPGIYLVTAKLPERDGEFEYYIKHLKAGSCSNEPQIPAGPPKLTREEALEYFREAGGSSRKSGTMLANVGSAERRNRAGASFQDRSLRSRIRFGLSVSCFPSPKRLLHGKRLLQSQHSTSHQSRW